MGSSPDDLAVGGPSRLTWAPDSEASFASLPTERGEITQLVTGLIQAPGDREPPSVVIVANGVLAGVTGGYDRIDAGWTFSSVLGPFLVRGGNQIRADEVTQVDGGPVLHLLG